MVATDIPFENSLIKNRISQTKLIQNLRSNCGFGKGLNILSLPFQSFIKTHILATIFSLFITDKYDTAFLIENLPELLWSWSIKVRNENRPWFVVQDNFEQSVRINLYLRLNHWANIAGCNSLNWVRSSSCGLLEWNRRNFLIDGHSFFSQEFRQECLGNHGSVSRKSRNLFGPEKQPFVKLRPVYSVKVLFVICWKGNKNENNCKVSCLETPSFCRYKENYVTRNEPEKFRDFWESGPCPSSQNCDITPS